MPEILNILDNSSANIILFNAMAEVETDDILDTFKITPQGGQSKAEVIVLVNGVEVPFSECLGKAVKHLIADYDTLVKKAAKKLITESKLNDLYRAIEESEWKISDILDELKIERF